MKKEKAIRAEWPFRAASCFFIGSAAGTLVGKYFHMIRHKNLLHITTTIELEPSVASHLYFLVIGTMAGVSHIFGQQGTISGTVTVSTVKSALRTNFLSHTITKSFGHSVKGIQLGDGFMIYQRIYSNYERGDVDIPTEILIKIADFHGVSVDYHLNRTADPNMTK